MKTRNDSSVRPPANEITFLNRASSRFIDCENFLHSRGSRSGQKMRAILSVDKALEVLYAVDISSAFGSQPDVDD
jgi:hypothetical protein